MLFPMIRELATSTGVPAFHCGSLRNPISVMLSEHDAVGDLLARLRRLTNGYTPPADGCASYVGVLHGDGGAGCRHPPPHPQGEQRAVPHGRADGSRTRADHPSVTWTVRVRHLGLANVSRPHNHLDRRGLAWGVVGVAIVIALTFIGSDRLVWFDAALVGYLFGVVFAVFGVAYRYAVWLRRPPTAMLNRRGWDAFRQRKARNAVALAVAGRDPPARTGIHPAPIPRTVARPSTGVLGLHPRRARHDPADARIAALRERRSDAPTTIRCTCRTSAR